jgi:hypothetical protein
MAAARGEQMGRELGFHSSICKTCRTGASHGKVRTAAAIPGFTETAHFITGVNMQIALVSGSTISTRTQ